MSASERVVQKFEPLTYRESKYVIERSKGLSKSQALKAAGFSPGLAHNPQFIETPEVLAAIESYRRELQETAVQTGLADSLEIHEYLTDALRARITDIQNDDFTYKPFSEWPPIWQQMYEGGDIEVTTEYARSQDGKDGEKRGGWDPASRVTDVKLKFSNKTKLIELLMKHKGVNAMVEAKSPELHLHLHAEITQKLQGALARKARLIEGKTSE